MKQILTLILILTSLTLSAQFGEKAGVNFSNTIFNTYSNNNITIQSNNKLLLGVHAGILRRININNMYIQPEVVLHIDKSSFTLTEKINNKTENYTQNFIRADIPIYFGYKVNPFRFYAGPVINGNLLSLTSKEDSQFAEYFDFLGSFSSSLSIGVGLDFGKIGIDISYQRNIIKFEQNLNKVWSSQDEIILKSHNNLIVLSFNVYN